MTKEQKVAWAEAQKIAIGEDLIAAAQRQLQFLAAVDRRRWLYDSPGLDRAIYRYKACWLNLLAKHGESQGPLVVPLDCEWIWHCHRLNPVQYKKDCESVYGKILDSKNVESSIQTESKTKSKEIWSELYPEEPFGLEFSTISPDKIPNINSNEASKITYDLVSASKRQTSFYYQVSKPGMSDERMLTSALERYKGFLYLIKTIQEKSLKIFCVPTYDVDIMWHSHQLSPVSYCKDSMNLVGKVLEHDDDVTDRSKGTMLDLWFGETTKQFEETFGLRYWKAGVMHRGAEPTAVTTIPVVPVDKILKKSASNYLDLPPTMVVEVFLEIGDVKNLQINESEIVYVSFGKKQTDMFFNGNGYGTLNIFSLTGEKQLAGFECEPTGDLTLTLISKSKSNSNSERVLGTTSISLEELTGPNSKLSIERWLEVKPNSSIFNPSPIYLRVAASCTVPVRAPYVLNMVKHENSFIHSIYGNDEIKEYLFVDHSGKEAIRVHQRENKMSSKKKLTGMTSSRKFITLAEETENKWLLNKTCNFSGTVKIKSCQDSTYTYTCELEGDHMVKLYLGKKLEYEEKCYCGGHSEGSFVTAVEFSTEHPYGKAIASLDFKSKIIKVNEEWFVLPWITLSSIFMDSFEKPSTKDEAITNSTLGPKNVPLKSSPGMASATASVKCSRGNCYGGNCVLTYENVTNEIGSVTKSMKCSRGNCYGGNCVLAYENVTNEIDGVAASVKCSRGNCYGGNCVLAYGNVTNEIDGVAASVKCSRGNCYGGNCVVA